MLWPFFLFAADAMLLFCAFQSSELASLKVFGVIFCSSAHHTKATYYLYARTHIHTPIKHRNYIFIFNVIHIFSRMLSRRTQERSVYFYDYNSEKIYLQIKCGECIIYIVSSRHHFHVRNDGFQLIFFCQLLRKQMC